MTGTRRAWSSANSFCAWTFPQDDQITLINTLREKNVRLIRIFLAAVGRGQEGSPYADSDMLARVDQFHIKMLPLMMLDVLN